MKVVNAVVTPIEDNTIKSIRSFDFTPHIKVPQNGHLSQSP